MGICGSSDAKKASPKPAVRASAPVPKKKAAPKIEETVVIDHTGGPGAVVQLSKKKVTEVRALVEKLEKSGKMTKKVLGKARLVTVDIPNLCVHATDEHTLIFEKPAPMGVEVETKPLVDFVRKLSGFSPEEEEIDEVFEEEEVEEEEEKEKITDESVVQRPPKPIKPKPEPIKKKPVAKPVVKKPVEKKKPVEEKKEEVSVMILDGKEITLDEAQEKNCRILLKYLEDNGKGVSAWSVESKAFFCSFKFVKSSLGPALVAHAFPHEAKKGRPNDLLIVEGKGSHSSGWNTDVWFLEEYIKRLQGTEVVATVNAKGQEDSPLSVEQLNICRALLGLIISKSAPLTPEEAKMEGNLFTLRLPGFTKRDLGNLVRVFPRKEGAAVQNVVQFIGVNPRSCKFDAWPLVDFLNRATGLVSEAVVYHEPSPKRDLVVHRLSQKAHLTCRDLLEEALQTGEPLKPSTVMEKKGHEFTIHLPMFENKPAYAVRIFTPAENGEISDHVIAEGGKEPECVRVNVWPLVDFLKQSFSKKPVGQVVLFQTLWGETGNLAKEKTEVCREALETVKKQSTVCNIDEIKEAGKSLVARLDLPGGGGHGRPLSAWVYSPPHEGTPISNVITIEAGTTKTSYRASVWPLLSVMRRELGYSVPTSILNHTEEDQPKESPGLFRKMSGLLFGSQSAEATPGTEVRKEEVETQIRKIVKLTKLKGKAIDTKKLLERNDFAFTIRLPATSSAAGVVIRVFDPQSRKGQPGNIPALLVRTLEDVKGYEVDVEQLTVLVKKQLKLEGDEEKKEEAAQPFIDKKCTCVSPAGDFCEVCLSRLSVVWSNLGASQANKGKVRCRDAFSILKEQVKGVIDTAYLDRQVSRKGHKNFEASDFRNFISGMVSGKKIDYLAPLSKSLLLTFDEGGGSLVKWEVFLSAMKKNWGDSQTSDAKDTLRRLFDLLQAIPKSKNRKLRAGDVVEVFYLLSCRMPVRAVVKF